MEKKENCCKPIKSKIGGQALIEGVMMRGLDKSAIAVLKPDGEIDLSVEPIKIGKGMKIINKIPVVRGVFNFVQSLTLGYGSLGKSAEIAGLEEEDEEPSKFEKWLEKTFGDNLMKVIVGLGMVLGLGAAILLFFFVPSLIVKGIDMLLPLGGFKSVIEGIIKMAIFIGYLAAVVRMKEIRRVFEYHGAEHKTIACYEAGEELTVENARKHSRFHPRCGTSFLFVVMIVSILFSSLFTWINPLVRVCIRLAFLPVIVGISYEFNRFVGRHDNGLTNALRAPGMMMQRFTTQEPDDSMLEVAILALQSVIPENEKEDRW